MPSIGTTLRINQRNEFQLARTQELVIQGAKMRESAIESVVELLTMYGELPQCAAIRHPFSCSEEVLNLQSSKVEALAL